MPKQKRIWVHIGLPKCGSSTIQGYFADHDAHYRTRGLCYPKSYRAPGGYRSHHPVAGADPAKLPEIVAEIKAEAGDARDILISCEDYTTNLPAGLGQALVAELKRAFPDDTVTVVAYFRNIYEFVESCYAQFVMAGLFKIPARPFFKKGKPPGMRKFVTAFKEVQGFDIYSIRQFIDAIDAAFPDTDIMLRSLEKRDLDGAGIIEDLCKVMGYVPLPMNKRRNTRASNRTIAAAQFLRTKLKKDEFLVVRKTLRKRGFQPGTKAAEAEFRNPEICIGSKLRDIIRARIAEEKDALPARFATRMDALIEDRWKPLVAESELTPAMRKKAMTLARRELGRARAAS